MSGIAFDTIRAAIHAWVVTGSGLVGSKIIWTGQRDSQGNALPRPTGLYVALSVLGIGSPGFDDVSVYTLNDDLTTVTQSITGPRTETLSIRVFQGSPVGGNDLDALRVLTDILTASDRDDVSLAMSLAKVAVGTYSDATLVTVGFNEAKQESVAVSTVKLHINSTLQLQSSQWIQNAGVTGIVRTEKGTETVTISVTS